MPDELIEKIQKSSYFNQAFMNLEYLAASILDLDWHTATDVDKNTDVNAFEKASMERIDLIPEIFPRYRTTNFSHLFSGSYAAGYYVYKWAAVLDADAFMALKERITQAQYQQSLQELGNLYGSLSQKAFRGELNLKDEGLLMAAELEVEYKKNNKITV